MSIPVPLAELREAMADRPYAYLLTSSASGGPHAVAVLPTLEGDVVVIDGVGRRSGSNAAAAPAVTLLWPPASPGGYSLIVDGTADVSAGSGMRVSAQRAVLHRAAADPAAAAVGDAADVVAGCTSDCVELPVAAPNG